MFSEYENKTCTQKFYDRLLFKFDTMSVVLSFWSEDKDLNHSVTHTQYKLNFHTRVHTSQDSGFLCALRFPPSIKLTAMI